MIICTVQWTIPPMNLAEFLEKLDMLAYHSNKDEGCISYTHYLEPNGSGRVFLYEEWESRELLDAHQKQPHVADFRAAIPDLLGGPPTMTIYEAKKVD